MLHWTGKSSLILDPCGQNLFLLNFFFFFFKKNILFIYFQREEKGGKKRGRETLMYERNIDWLPLAHPQLGIWPATQACALTGNWTSNLSVSRLVLNLLSYTSQGFLLIFLLICHSPGYIVSMFVWQWMNVLPEKDLYQFYEHDHMSDESSPV